MRVGLAVLALLTATAAAHAEDIAPNTVPEPIPAVAPDPNTKITLTFGQLQALIAAQVAEARARDAAQAAQGAVKAVQDQLVKPPSR